MIWKGCLVLSVALFVLCEGRSAFSEVTVKKHNNGYHSEVSKSDHKSTENHEEYEKSHPSYEFSYKVIDPHTHDKKGQQETRDGDTVTGHYWLIQPDGHKRLVKYNVDGKHGFTAHVNYALHDEHHKDSERKDSEYNVHESEHENKDEEKGNDHKGDEADKPDDDIKEEMKEEEHKDKKLEKESEEFESKKINEEEEEKKIDEKHDEEERKEEKKSDETPNVHEKEEDDNKNEHDHDLWSQIRRGKLEMEDKHDDVWSWPKKYSWGGDIEYKDDKNPEVHEERDNNEGNVWSWRKAYDVWEVRHLGGKGKEENDNKDKPIKEERIEKRPEEDGDKKKDRRRNVGLRDYEHRGQPSYHTPIMRMKPVPYRRRRIVN